VRVRLRDQSNIVFFMVLPRSETADFAMFRAEFHVELQLHDPAVSQMRPGPIIVQLSQHVASVHSTIVVIMLVASTEFDVRVCYVQAHDLIPADISQRGAVSSIGKNHLRAIMACLRTLCQLTQQQLRESTGQQEQDSRDGGRNHRLLLRGPWPSGQGAWPGTHLQLQASVPLR
jgi:hypothetical protein